MGEGAKAGSCGDSGVFAVVVELKNSVIKPADTNGFGTTGFCLGGTEGR